MGLTGMGLAPQSLRAKLEQVLAQLYGFSNCMATVARPTSIQSGCAHACVPVLSRADKSPLKARLPSGPPASKARHDSSCEDLRATRPLQHASSASPKGAALTAKKNSAGRASGLLCQRCCCASGDGGMCTWRA